MHQYCSLRLRKFCNSSAVHLAHNISMSVVFCSYFHSVYQIKMPFLFLREQCTLQVQKNCQWTHERNVSEFSSFCYIFCFCSELRQSAFLLALGRNPKCSTINSLTFLCLSAVLPFVCVLQSTGVQSQSIEASKTVLFPATLICTKSHNIINIISQDHQL